MQILGLWRDIYASALFENDTNNIVKYIELNFVQEIADTCIRKAKTLGLPFDPLDVISGMHDDNNMQSKHGKDFIQKLKDAVQ